MVLLPEGKIINNPDSVKLIKVLPTALNDETFFVVAIKLDDDSELMVDRCTTRVEAEALADRCCRLLNGEELASNEIPSFVEEGESDSDSDWDFSDEEPESKTATTASSTTEEESSSWDLSSSEDRQAASVSLSNEQKEEESSSWDLSSSEDQPSKTNHVPVSKSPQVEEESSSWGFSSSEDEQEVPPKSTVSKKAGSQKNTSKNKPKIQKPYSETDDPVESLPPSDEAKVSISGPEEVEVEEVPKIVPQVTGFIEDDSDEWIQDNGLDDWYD